ncbi:hypothetical protein C8J57DRAFT_1498118 [Mycena rebaudengoi]|nr:hypothetical protein C8J57DRAFT_1498118 [Mycena rebaudengoi]
MVNSYAAAFIIAAVVLNAGSIGATPIRGNVAPNDLEDSSASSGVPSGSDYLPVPSQHVHSHRPHPSGLCGPPTDSAGSAIPSGSGISGIPSGVPSDIPAPSSLSSSGKLVKRALATGNNLGPSGISSSAFSLLPSQSGVSHPMPSCVGMGSSSGVPSAIPSSSASGSSFESPPIMPSELPK